MTIIDPLASDVSIVTLAGEVDIARAQDVRDELLVTIDRGGIHLVVDGRDVTFMDSSGVNALVRARDRAERLGGSIHVVATGRPVLRVLEVTQLTRLLHLVATMEQALACLARPELMHSCEPPR